MMRQGLGQPGVMRVTMMGQLVFYTLNIACFVEMSAFRDTWARACGLLSKQADPLPIPPPRPTPAPPGLRRPRQCALVRIYVTDSRALLRPSYASTYPLPGSS